MSIRRQMVTSNSWSLRLGKLSKTKMNQGQTTDWIHSHWSYFFMCVLLGLTQEKGNHCKEQRQCSHTRQANSFWPPSAPKISNLVSWKVIRSKNNLWIDVTFAIRVSLLGTVSLNKINQRLQANKAYICIAFFYLLANIHICRSQHMCAKTGL